MPLSSNLYSTLLNLTDFYIYFIYFATAIFGILIPLYAYLIVNVMPKKASTYKWLLSSCIYSSIISVTTRCLLIPVPTLPIMGVYSAGYLNFLGPKATLICLNIYLACTVNSQLCITFCLIFQYSAVKPFSWLAKFGYCPKCIVRVYAAYFIAMVSCLTIFLHMSIVDQSDFANYANLTENYYALELIQHQPSWIGFSGAIKPIVYIFAFFAVIPDFLIAILAITLTIKLYFIIKADKAHVSLITRGLEKNLYYTFVFRTLMLIFLFTIPYFCIVGTIVFGIVNSSIGIICHCIMVLQTLVCLIGTLIIIKPFRIFVFRCFYDKNGDSSNSNSSSSSSEGSFPSSVTFQSLPSLPSKKSFS